MELPEGSEIEHAGLNLVQQWKLAFSGDLDTRWYLARNQGLDAQVQDVLQMDLDPEVRDCLAANPTVENHILLKLARDVETSVRCEVARRPELPEYIQIELRSDVRPLVRASLAGAPNLSYETQHYFLIDEVVDSVRGAFTGNRLVTWSNELPARLFQKYNPEGFTQQTSDCDQELVKSLMQNWQGSVTRLIEATRLVTA